MCDWCVTHNGYWWMRTDDEEAAERFDAEYKGQWAAHICRCQQCGMEWVVVMPAFMEPYWCDFCGASDVDFGGECEVEGS